MLLNGCECAILKLKKRKHRQGKRLVRKNTEDNNDAFADIVNGFVFGGKQIIQPGDLQNTALKSMYRSIHSGARPQISGNSV
ncbi:hypothetical protein [Bilifractor sp. HCP3S3_D3]|uniref:hypothetical protein n=1 Tax=Bilifractor sp. HCP3S3_D3 TaxID=3438907 RepID=UPI003F88C526